jgi:hypothetical protein
LPRAQRAGPCLGENFAAPSSAAHRLAPQASSAASSFWLGFLFLTLRHFWPNGVKRTGAGGENKNSFWGEGRRGRRCQKYFFSHKKLVLGSSKFFFLGRESQALFARSGGVPVHMKRGVQTKVKTWIFFRKSGGCAQTLSELAIRSDASQKVPPVSPFADRVTHSLAKNSLTHSQTREKHSTKVKR